MKNVLNLGILAHVDAGKTSLTERLLYAAGAIAEIGSVDAGSTQTDSLELERQRGITIKSAVVSFVIDDLTINLIDTPGHPDFIAEVERVLNVLDGAVLVVSAVEGVQAQTRVLMRTLRRLRIPVLIFVNKIDRRGARDDALLRSIAEKLTPDAIALGGTRALGTPGADFEPYGPGDEQLVSALIDRLSAHDDALLAACVESELHVPFSALWHGLVAQTQKLQAHPLFFGSAITGAGVGALIEGIRELLPRADAANDGPLSAVVFKIERGAAGEKVAVVRLFSGSVGVRETIRLRSDGEARVTAIEVFEQGSTVRRSAASAGEIALLWGLDSAQVGDWLGVPARATHGHHFAAPTLETVVVPRHAEQRGALHAALSQLAEQDPLINLRRSGTHEISVSLYGEVQKEVLGATLASDFGIEASFRETTSICVERPLSTGTALELIGRAGNPFWAALGLRIEPAAPGSGVRYELAVEVGVMAVAFFKAIREAVLATLEQGLLGWQVTDCTVTVTHTGFISPLTRAGDFRALAPLVVMSALAQAGTRVCEPMLSYRLEVPTDTLEPVLLALGQRRATTHAPTAQGSAVVLEGLIPAAQVHALAQRLPGLTHGEGSLEHTFDHHRAVHGDAPSRPRTDHNPLSRKEYLLHVVRRV